MIGIDEIHVLVVMVELFLGLFLSGLFLLELTSFDAHQFWLCVGSWPGCVLLLFFSLFFFAPFFVLYFDCIFIVIFAFIFIFVLLTTGRR